MIRITALGLSLLVAAPAHAGDVGIRVVDASGAPLADAVVTIHPAAGVFSGPIRFPWKLAMVQRNISFEPSTLIVPAGATVPFPNEDKVRHHVYSFSKPARFEIKLFGRDETRSYTFKSPGAVALGCNIHDRMAGFIKVVDTPFAMKTDADGMSIIRSVTGGRARLTVWHPRMRARDNEVTFDIDVPASGDLTRRIQVALR
ncbi:methylamine utilization protein [Sphingomonas spermidinifaciens]|uniref:Methylamine utilization protein n=1 Tax=Sphingomonas spermidinifaciens TaxID=1141889 RepID=A0A2A4B266_9SPHN|nr:methylamine utilization protein [Sphingomonas spermidinifaciens]PCD02170.1 methylamine utilization protein [Sphingomonas spermidinifaciens]